MVAQAAQTARTGGAGGFAVSRHQLLRYAAALCGLVALVLFFQPWVDASLNVAGDASLNGIELARGDASHRVNAAIFGGRTTGSGSPGSAPAVAPGGVVLPTRIPTVAPSGAGGSSGFGTTAGAAGSAGAAQPTTAAIAAPGGVVIPTRIPTVAPGGSAGFGTTAGAAAQQTPQATAAGGSASRDAPTASPAAPPVLPTFWFYVIPFAALGLATMPVVWDRFADHRDRRYGRVWTLLLSYGGALFLGYVLWRIATEPATNALLGPGVGAVRSALPALWGSFAGFLTAAVLLTIVWLMPSPPAPDPYGRARPA